MMEFNISDHLCALTSRNVGTEFIKLCFDHLISQSAQGSLSAGCLSSFILTWD